MIVNFAEAQVALGMTSVSALDRALIEMLLPMIKAAIMDDPGYGLGYDPEYMENRIEWYPQADRGGGGSGDGNGYWDTNSAGTKASFYSYGRTTDLQLRQLPVRSVAEVRVDYNGGFGQKASTFGDDTKKTVGEDWFLKLTQTGISEEGVLYAHVGWPTEPGSIKVTYTSGYTADEFSGRATTRINAVGIKTAYILTLAKLARTFKALAQRANGSFPAGPLSSESLGEYSYAVDGAAAAAMTGMLVSISPEAGSYLQAFRNYGLMIT